MSVTCPACGSARAETLETQRDRVLGREYRWQSCGDCAASYAWPCEQPGADWYERAVPEEPSRPAGSDPRFSAFFADVPPGPGLLDLGCGDGGFLALAARRGYAPCVGLDHDHRRAQAARARGLDVRVEDWAAFLRAQPDGRFHAITLFDVLEHLSDPRALLRELRRVLAPSGRLALTVPNARRPMPFGREDFDLAPHHLTRWTPEALTGLLAREGFELVHLNAGRMDWTHTREIMALHWGVKPALALARRVLFGAKAAGSVTELYAKSGNGGALASKGARRTLFAAARAAALAAASLPAAGLCLWWRLSTKDSGPSIYASARKNA